MKIERLNKENSKNYLEEWRNNGHESKNVSSEYIEIRNNLTSFYEEAKERLSENDNRDKYIMDVKMGLSLYTYLLSKEWFSLRLASDDDYWRYISVVVVPHIVADRWGEDNETYFWKQSNRIWLKTMWWYIHLTWQNDLESTYNILTLPSFNSDMIQGLVERTGKNGTYVDVYRAIVSCYSKIQMNELIKYKKRTSGKSDTFFRAVMKLNTARCQVVNPCLCKGGAQAYANSLVNDILQSIN